MNPSRFFIRRPIATVMLALAVVLVGLLAWRLLPVAPLPQVDFPSITVSASLPGASPESMAATVATPLERALGSIAGVDELISSSNQGATQVNLRFDLDRDINAAARDVQAALNSVRGELPAGMPGNPTYRKMNPSQAPIMVLALSSANLAPGVLYDAASTLLAQKIQQIAGVGDVAVGGSSLPAVRVQLNPEALVHYGVALDEVRDAIAASNALRPLGALEQDARRWQISASEPLRRASDYRDLIVRYRNGAAVRLGAVAAVTDSVEDRYSSGFHNERAAVILIISRQPGANIVETVDAIGAQLPALRALLPADAELTVVMDRSSGIRATLGEAQFTLLAAVALVVLVVWLFLGNARAALIPTVAIPVSLLGTFAVMYLYGFSLNNLSLMALIVAAGLVVDDAIVVLENIRRHIEAGASPLRAALRASREVGFTLLAMNLALVAVFVSILLMGGVVERLFREFTITLAAAVLVSLLVSLSLTPSLCAHLLGPVRAAAPRGRVAGAGQALFARLQRGYARSLDWSLRHGALIAALLATVAALNFYLYVAIPKEVLPEQDTGQLRGFVRGDDGFSFQIMQPKIEAYRQLLLADPAVQEVTGTSGGSGGISNAGLMVKLKPRAQRTESSRQVIDRLRRVAPPVPGGLLWLNVDQDISLGGHSFNDSAYQLLLLSGDLQALRDWAKPVEDALTALPELVDVDGAGDGGTQQVRIDVDREAAQRLGVDMQTVSSLLNNSFAQRQVATLYDDLNQYRVVLELEPRYTESPEILQQVQVIAADGRRVPLAAFATYRYTLANDRVFHSSQFAAVGIGYSLAPGVSLEQAQRAIDAALARVMLPSSIHTQPGGEADAVQDTLRRQPLLILGVVVMVYLVLGIVYESLLHPLTILTTLPSAGIGALLALLLSKTPFSLIALLGLFLLIGLVMKNAILMIDFAIDGQRRLGLSAAAAIRRAAALRLRPILMTNLAALLGALPLALGVGEGSELRRPLGIAIVGGLAVSQLLTLYTTPVVFLYLERLQDWRRRRAAALAQPGAT